MDLNAQNSNSTEPKAGDLQGTAASTVHDVLARAESATAGAEAKIQPVVSKMPQAAQAPIYRAVHTAADAVESVREGADELMQRQGAFMDSATEYVRSKPRQSIAIALGIGFLIARVLL